KVRPSDFPILSQQAENDPVPAPAEVIALAALDLGRQSQQQIDNLWLFGRERCPQASEFIEHIRPDAAKECACKSPAFAGHGQFDRMPVVAVEHHASDDIAVYVKPHRLK